jgi:hypothetical protein
VTLPSHLVGLLNNLVPKRLGKRRKHLFVEATPPVPRRRGID